PAADHSTQRVVLVGVIGMEHPFGAVAAHHRKIRVAVHDGHTEYFPLKDQRFVDVADQQIDGQPRERAAILSGWHPGLARASFHLSASVSRPTYFLHWN